MAEHRERSDRLVRGGTTDSGEKSSLSRRSVLAGGAALAAAPALGPAHAQTPIDSRTALPIPQAPAKAPLAYDAHEAKAPAIKPLRALAGAPNVIIVLVDDMGFGASSAFGGPCNMPTAEHLAANGLKFTRFHTTAMC